MFNILHEHRQRLRAELVLRLRALEPQIGNETHLMRYLLAEYNALLVLARQLQDAVLDDLEAAQDRGDGYGAIDFAHHLWSRLDLVSLIVPEVPALTDAARLESLPGDV
jgi:hypothetical protein